MLVGRSFILTVGPKTGFGLLPLREHLRAPHERFGGVASLPQPCMPIWAGIRAALWRAATEAVRAR